MMKRGWRLEWTYAVIAMIIIVSLLFTGKFIGVADNGDFLRIMGSIGLNDYDASATYDERYFKYAHQLFAYDSFLRGFYPSTQLILVFIARMIAFLFDSSHFDIRFLAALYSIILVTACGMLIAFFKRISTAVGIALMLLLLFVFHDIGYVAYFNSLYGEPVSLMFLLLTIALGLYIVKEKGPSKKLLLSFVACCLFLICSKTQNAPLGLFFSLLCIRYAYLFPQHKSWKRLALGCSAAIIIIAAAMYLFAPKDFKQINLYQTVFFGILYESPNVEEDLQQLGLDKELSVLAGTNYFQSDTAIKQDDPILQDMFYNKLSHMDVAMFYLSNLDRLWQRMTDAASYSLTIRPYYLGNYEKSAGEPAGAVSFQYSAWSELKRNVLPNTLLFIIIVFLLFFAIACYEWLRSHQRRIRMGIELIGTIGIVAGFGFLIPLVGDGMADLSKHLFMFNVAFDMMLVVIVTWMIYKISSIVHNARR